MRYSRVLFVIPRLLQKLEAPFVGVGYLSEFLTGNKIENAVIDMNLGHDDKDVFAKIRAFKPHLIAMPVMTRGHKIAYELIDGIKEKFPVDVVIGGAHVSSLRAKVLQGCRADFAIKLEGETALRDLCLGITPDAIDNLIYRQDGTITENKDATFIKDLDSLPFPTYEKFELKKYLLPAGIPIITSRGCPYGCIYCSVKNVIGRVLRTRNPQNVVAEIGYWRNRGYKKIALQDDNFTFYRDRVLKIIEGVQEKGLMDITFSCPNGVRADRVDADLLGVMRRVGFKQLCFGVEAGNNKVLTMLKKGESIEAIESAIKNSCDLGFDVVLFFLVGSPGETPEDVEDSFKLALRYPVTDVFFYNLIPFPATELFTWVTDNNLFVQSPEVYLASGSPHDTSPKFATPEFPLEERIRVLTRAKDVRKTVRKRSIERRLPKWVTARKLWSAVLASDFGQNHILGSKIFWTIYDRMSGR